MIGRARKVVIVLRPPQVAPIQGPTYTLNRNEPLSIVFNHLAYIVEQSTIASLFKLPSLH